MFLIIGLNKEIRIYRIKNIFKLSKMLIIIIFLFCWIKIVISYFGILKKYYIKIKLFKKINMEIFIIFFKNYDCIILKLFLYN